MAETEWCEALQTVGTSLLSSVEYETTFTRSSKDIPNLLNETVAEVDRRLKLEDDERLQLPDLFLVMTELERVDELRRQDDGYGMVDSPAGQQLQRLCSKGSSVGVHVILSLSGVRPLTNILDERRGLVNFRHRVTLQISENDSFTLVGVREASRLQIGGTIPVCALYADMERDITVRFKPYNIESDIPMSKQLTEISDRLNQWRS